MKMMEQALAPKKILAVNQHQLAKIHYHKTKAAKVDLIPRSHYRAITTIAIIVSDRDIQAKTKI